MPWKVQCCWGVPKIRTKLFYWSGREFHEVLETARFQEIPDINSLLISLMMMMNDSYLRSGRIIFLLALAAGVDLLFSMAIR